MKTNVLMIAAATLLLASCSEKEQNASTVEYNETVQERIHGDEQDSTKTEDLKTPSGMPAQSETNVDVK